MQRRAEIHLKSLYFVTFLAIGLFWPFVYPYYSKIGLTGTEVGLVITVSALTAILAATWWGELNDRLGRVRVLLGILCGAAVVVCQVLGAQHTVLGIIVVSGVLSSFTGPILPLLDSTTLVMLGEQRERYGAYRVWGTVGVVVGSVVMGVLLGRVDSRAIFIAFSIVIAAAGLLAQRLPDRKVRLEDGTTAAHRAGGRPNVSAIGVMLRQSGWPLFALSVFILYAAISGGMSFVGIIITQMGGDARTIGLASTIAALTELPFFQYSSYLLRRLGPVRMLMIAMGIYALRMLFYGLMPSVGWVLALALLQGASYGPFQVSTVAYTDRAAPENMKSTAQGMLVSVISMSNLVAGLMSGWLLDRTGRAGLYTILAATCGVALALFSASRLPGWVTGGTAGGTTWRRRLKQAVLRRAGG